MRNGAGNVCATGSWSSPISTSTSTRTRTPFHSSHSLSPPLLSLSLLSRFCLFLPVLLTVPPVQLPVGCIRTQTKRNAVQSVAVSTRTDMAHAIHIYYIYTIYIYSWRTFAPRPIPLMSVNQGNCYFFNNFSLALCLSRELYILYESQNPSQSESQSQSQS